MGGAASGISLLPPRPPVPVDLRSCKGSKFCSQTSPFPDTATIREKTWRSADNCLHSRVNYSQGESLSDLVNCFGPCDRGHTGSSVPATQGPVQSGGYWSIAAPAVAVRLLGSENEALSAPLTMVSTHPPKRSDES